MTDAELERALAEKLEPEPPPIPTSGLWVEPRMGLRSNQPPTMVCDPAPFATDGNAMLALIEAMQAGLARSEAEADERHSPEGEEWRHGFWEDFTAYIAMELSAVRPEGCAIDAIEEEIPELLWWNIAPRAVAVAAAKALGVWVEETEEQEHA